MIASYQEAQFLYLTCEEERCEREIALRVALAGLRLAEQKFQYARKRLTKAEFRLGRTRYMVKKGGFSDALKHSGRRQPGVQVVAGRVYRTYVLSYYLNLPHNQSSDNRLTSIPGPQFTINLD
jgi:hypothetical protein